MLYEYRDTGDVAWCGGDGGVEELLLFLSFPLITLHSDDTYKAFNQIT